MTQSEMEAYTAPSRLPLQTEGLFSVFKKAKYVDGHLSLRWILKVQGGLMKLESWSHRNLIHLKIN